MTALLRRCMSRCYDEVIQSSDHAATFRQGTSRTRAERPVVLVSSSVALDRRQASVVELVGGTFFASFDLLPATAAAGG